jgi:hypothetical protein
MCLCICPYCDTRINLGERWLGTAVVCDKCGVCLLSEEQLRTEKNEKSEKRED